MNEHAGTATPPAATIPELTRYAWLSIAAALATMALKGIAYLLTGSVGLLSDAMESLVNLAGAAMAFFMLRVAAQPADAGHAHGHGKAEYFASGFEGLLILAAAAAIAVAAVQRLIEPRDLERVGAGLAVSAAATVINFAVARVLLSAGQRHHSIALEADAHHLMTDVWTSIGVIAGVLAVAATGFTRLDPLIAIAVAAHIVWVGLGLVRRSVGGLMDASLTPEHYAMVIEVLERYRAQGIDYHALRTRQAGQRMFVSVHILVPGAWSVSRGHALLERIEADLRTALPRASVITHLEPLEEAVSWHDADLDRS